MALSAEESSRLTGLLGEHAERITNRWTELLAASLRGRLSQAELRRQVQELHHAMIEAARSGGFDLESESAGELRAVLAELSRGRARQGFTATETATSVYALKDVMLEVLETDTTDARTLRDYVAFSSLVDQMGLFTFESFVRTRESLIADQAEQLLELSTPVVKIWEGVVAVPLVGTLDSARAQVVMERLLQTLVDTSSPYAIIDITGVPAVDTQVAQHILKTVVAARLMGADCIISGIRPQIAQTIVALGIEFGDIATKASLADALRHVLRLTGVEAARRQPRRES
ncbi:STAS domain-containing protein [Micromonospora sp. KC207]|uniref:STAS domain-containing protein n=1 Tax=Micromonospora sp. KC207 TaxID=2530377 RepID=UPI00104DEAC0|nr:STAS domain-containing protein [Micromonospora sp. KC207]TDC56513.1 STAS domain-containing protein [Micromonospora sp. KC207]